MTWRPGDYLNPIKVEPPCDCQACSDANLIRRLSDRVDALTKELNELKEAA